MRFFGGPNHLKELYLEYNFLWNGPLGWNGSWVRVKKVSNLKLFWHYEDLFQGKSCPRPSIAPKNCPLDGTQKDSSGKFREAGVGKLALILFFQTLELFPLFLQLSRSRINLKHVSFIDCHVTRTRVWKPLIAFAFLLIIDHWQANAIRSNKSTSWQAHGVPGGLWKENMAP